MTTQKQYAKSKRHITNDDVNVLRIIAAGKIKQTNRITTMAQIAKMERLRNRAVALAIPAAALLVVGITLVVHEASYQDAINHNALYSTKVCSGVMHDYRSLNPDCTQYKNLKLAGMLPKYAHSVTPEQMEKRKGNPE